MADPPGQSHSAQGDPEWMARAQGQIGSHDRLRQALLTGSGPGQGEAAKGRHFHAHAHGDSPCLLGSWYLMALAFPGFVLLS